MVGVILADYWRYDKKSANPPNIIPANMNNTTWTHFFTGCFILEYWVLKSEEGEKGNAEDIFDLVGLIR